MYVADFPKDLPKKLKAIRERLQLDPDQFAEDDRDLGFGIDSIS